MAKSTPLRSAEKDDPIFTGKFTFSSHTQPKASDAAGPINPEPKSSNAKPAQTNSMKGWHTMSTLEQHLERRLARHGEGDFVVKQLRRQIAAKNSGQSAQDLYVTGAVKKVQPQQ